MVFGLGEGTPIRVTEKAFNSLWELDGVRTSNGRDNIGLLFSAFNSLWELDGVRTVSLGFEPSVDVYFFQFPVGIRWCSDSSQTAKNLCKYALSIPCGN